jgi:hypothetical protein
MHADTAQLCWNQEATHLGLQVAHGALPQRAQLLLHLAQQQAHPVQGVVVILWLAGEQPWLAGRVERRRRHRCCSKAPIITRCQMIGVVTS